MLWFDGKGVAHFKKNSTEVVENTQSITGEINKADRFKVLFEFMIISAMIIIIMMFIQGRLFDARSVAIDKCPLNMGFSISTLVSNKNSFSFEHCLSLIG